MIALRAAFRHLRKNIRYVAFNTFGLALGFTSFFFISIFVLDELQYDSHHENKANIFRIESRLKLTDDVSDYATVPPAVGGNIKAAIPEVIASCRWLPETGNRFELSGKLIKEDKVYYSDPAVFTIFTLPLIEGNAETALRDVNSVVLSEVIALKYFNSTDIVGKTMVMHNDDTSLTLRVTGVMKNVVPQSHFHFDLLISMNTLPLSRNNNYLSFYPFSTYILKLASTDVKALEQKINRWYQSSVPDYKEIEKGGSEVRILLTSLKDIHLKSDKKYELGKNGNIQYIYVFSIGTVFILFMAGLNFMNLSLARFSKRSREVAVRKILGSSAKKIGIQFLFESLILCAIAAIIAILAGWSLISYFNSFAGKQIEFYDILNSWILPFMLVTSILLGLASGIFPAITLSSFNPVFILGGKNFIHASGNLFSLKNVLMASQFIVSTFLITGTVIIYRQLTFINEKKSGYTKDGIIIIKNTSALSSPAALKEKVLSIPGVVSATFSNFLPTNNIRWSNFGGTSTSVNPVQTEFWPVDEDYLPTLGIDVIKGRNFDKTYLTDSAAVILNETAYREFGMGDKIFSERISFSYRQHQQSFHAIGVVKDFHFNSFRQKIGPLVFVLSDNTKANLVVKWRGDSHDLAENLNDAWNTLHPQEKMDITYMDDEFRMIYKDDRMMANLFLLFSSLSIIIASLGLFGLTNYNVAVRKKEIAIRKILGASFGSVAVLISRQYLVLILSSIALAIPAAWYLMTKWLQQFAYRYDGSYLDYVFAGALSFLIAILTLSSSFLTIERKRLVENMNIT